MQRLPWFPRERVYKYYARPGQMVQHHGKKVEKPSGVVGRLHRKNKLGFKAHDILDKTTHFIEKQKSKVKSIGRICAETVAKIALDVSLNVKNAKNDDATAHHLLGSSQLTLSCMKVSMERDYSGVVDPDVQDGKRKEAEELLEDMKFRLSMCELKNRKLVDGTYEIDKYGEVCEIEEKFETKTIKCANAKKVSTESSDFPFNAQYCSIIIGGISGYEISDIIVNYLQRSSDNLLGIEKCRRITQEINKITTGDSKLENTCKDPKCFNTSHYKISECNVISKYTETNDKNFRVHVYRRLVIATRVISNIDDIQQNLPLCEEIIIQMETIDPMKPTTQGNDKQPHPAYQNTKTCLILNASYESASNENTEWLHFFGENAFSVQFNTKKNYISQDRSEAIARSAGYVARQLANITNNKQEAHDKAIQFFAPIFNNPDSNHQEIKRIIDKNLEKDIKKMQQEYTRATNQERNSEQNQQKDASKEERDVQHYISNSFLCRQHANKLFSIKHSGSFQVQLWSSGPTFGILIVRPYANSMKQYAFIQAFDLVKNDRRLQSSQDERERVNEGEKIESNVERSMSEGVLNRGNTFSRRTSSKPQIQRHSSDPFNRLTSGNVFDEFEHEEMKQPLNPSELDHKAMSYSSQPDKLTSAEMAALSRPGRLHHRRSRDIDDNMVSGKGEHVAKSNRWAAKTSEREIHSNDNTEREYPRPFSSRTQRQPFTRAEFQNSTLPLELELELNEL
jgi:hypothetical protein